MLAAITYTSCAHDETERFDLPSDEQGFWRAVAAFLPKLDVPSRLSVATSSGDAVLDVTARGTFVKDGAEQPSMFVIPIKNDIALAPSRYADAYLTCINPSTHGGRGNYKFYRLSQKPDGTVTAFYGRIGQKSGFGAEREIKNPMPSWMFEIRKAEKVSKGYVDRTETYLGGKSFTVGDNVMLSVHGDGLYQKLLSFARNRVASSLATGTVVTSAQVEESGKLLNRIGRCRKVSSFNQRLLELMSISPRNVASVESELASCPGDFKRIIDREESLIAAMRAVVDADGDRSKRGSRHDAFEDAGIAWREADAGEFEDVLRNLPHNLRGKVRRVYCIDPAEQRKRFSGYLDERGMTQADVRLMWHGSRNENWCSIVSHSLMLNPNAKVTGKMFGYGIYFGYDDFGGGAAKSWNYTSAFGSYWAHGTSETAFMGLYECAYGKAYNPRDVRQFTQSWLDSNGFDCVHARGGDCGLRYDEVVYYDERAVCIKYLVEFGA